MQKTVNDIALTTDFTKSDIEYSIRYHKDIYKNEFGFSDVFMDIVDKTIGVFADTYNKDTDFMLIAKVDDEFAGTITGFGEADGKMRLRYYFVCPVARGKGVGKLIFTTAMELSKEMGYKKAYFSTYDALEVARNMYRKLGFVITGKEPADDIRPGLTEEFWEKEL